MSDYDELEQAVQAAVEEENARDCMPEDHEYVVEVNEHASGPALDIWRDEAGTREVPDKVHGPLVQPALDCGWVPSGVNRSIDTSLRKGDHVRIFLRRIEDECTEAVEDARAEGFAAGLWFASLAMVCDALQPDHTDEWAEFFEGETAGAATDGFGVTD